MHLLMPPVDFIRQTAVESFLHDPTVWSSEESAYTTHARFMSLTNQDDLAEVSNYQVAKDLLVAAQDAEIDVQVGREQHWAYGSYEVLYVQPRRDGHWTPAFLVAAQIAWTLITYPVLDEDDLDARREEAFNNWWYSVACAHLGDEFPLDTPEQVSLIGDLTARAVVEQYGYDTDLDWREFVETWRYSRDEVFGQLAHEYAVAQIEGQGVLGVVL